MLPYPARLQTQSLLLQRLSAEDVSDRYVEWLNDPEVNRFLETRLYSPGRHEVFRYVYEREEDPLCYLLGIFRDGAHIGNIQLRQPLSFRPVAEISIFIGEKSEWGKGYATEAIAEVVNFGFEALGLKTIWAGFYPEHTASMRAFEKAGMTEVARLPGFIDFRPTLHSPHDMVDWVIMAARR